MNREILFRGKLLHSNEWIEGKLMLSYYMSDPEESDEKFYKTCIQNESGSYVVDENTVGEFTGIIDTNGVKIFEYDIVSGISKNTAYVVRFENGAFFTNVCLVSFGDHTVIGNIHDNPELLK